MVQVHDDSDVGNSAKKHVARDFSFMNDYREISSTLLERLKNDKIDMAFVLVKALGRHQT